jgi:hypothetical protein
VTYKVRGLDSPALLCTLIHPSAWKVNSANLGLTEFQELSMHQASPWTVALPLRERDQASYDARAGLHEGIWLG